VSGLPGSGKSTVGRALAEQLALPVFDKDVILEALYDSLGPATRTGSGRLSRAGDVVLFTLAAQAARTVLDNWWHRDSAPARLRQLGSRAAIERIPRSAGCWPRTDLAGIPSSLRTLAKGVLSSCTRDVFLQVDGFFF
jgi:hypothetical protein